MMTKGMRRSLKEYLMPGQVMLCACRSCEALHAEHGPMEGKRKGGV